ncbi:hypothetical protein GGR58DRAFT_503325 [Xylaria digitata]|nr:hypothetical protein GGR58DRAFT_503325 [Xylaria digitata]
MAYHYGYNQQSGQQPEGLPATVPGNPAYNWAHVEALNYEYSYLPLLDNYNALQVPTQSFATAQPCVPQNGSGTATEIAYEYPSVGMPCLRISGSREARPKPRRKRKVQREVPCVLCDGTFADRRGLHRHYWSHHPVYAEKENIPSERVNCKHCDKSVRKDYLAKHMQSKRSQRLHGA